MFSTDNTKLERNILLPDEDHENPVPDHLELPKIILTADRPSRHSSPAEVITQDVSKIISSKKPRNSFTYLPQWGKNSSTDESETINKYSELPGSIITIDLTIVPTMQNTSEPPSLGLRLVGNRNLNQMSVFVCGILPGSLVEQDGRIELGDQLLEVNQHTLYGLSHLNAAPLIRSAFLETYGKCSRKSSLQSNSPAFRIVLQRYDLNINSMAVPSIHLAEVSPKSSRRSSTETNYYNPLRLTSFKRKASPFHETQTEKVHEVNLIRTPRGFGFKVIRTDKENIEGFYVSRLIPGGSAKLTRRLRVGDRLISVNGQSAKDLSLKELNNLIASSHVQLHLQIGRLLNTNYKTSSIARNLAEHYRCLSNTVLYDFNSIHHRGEGNHFFRPFQYHFPARNSQPSFEQSLEPTSHRLSCPNITSSFSTNRRHKSDVVNPMMAEISSYRLSYSSISNDSARYRPITPNAETEIEIEVGANRGLGIRCIGGSETSKNHIVIHQIYEGGAVAHDGRLQPGDVIVRINNHPLFGIPFLRAQRQLTKIYNSALRRLSNDSSVTTGVRLKVYRCDNVLTACYDVEFEVELCKKVGKGLGICISDRSVPVHKPLALTAGNGDVRKSWSDPKIIGPALSDNHGVIISDVIKGSVAAADGRLKVNDQILSVNGEDTRQADRELVCALVRLCQLKVVLKIGRLKNQVATNILQDFLLPS